jgi:hypothetical protein
VQRFTRSTCFGGVPNSGEHDCAIPVARVLGSSSGKHHGLLGDLSEGLDRAEEGGKGVGHGGCPRAALAGRWEVAGAMGELGGVRRGTKEATGMMAGHWVGFIAAARAWSWGDRGRMGFRVRACSERAPPPRVPAHVEHVGVYFCQGSTTDLIALACKSWQNPRVRSLPCTKSYLFYVSSKQGYGRSREIRG